MLSGGAMLFEPDADEEAELIPIQGARIALGFRGECRVELMAEISRSEYVASFGPTVGDRVRLADTDIVSRS